MSVSTGSQALLTKIQVLPGKKKGAKASLILAGEQLSMQRGNGQLDQHLCQRSFSGRAVPVAPGGFGLPRPCIYLGS